jgi:hypothetical protein
MSFVDALTRIGQIDQQFEQLNGTAPAATATATASTGTTGTSGTTGGVAVSGDPTATTAAASSPSFASALADAQGASFPTLAGSQEGQTVSASTSTLPAGPLTGGVALPFTSVYPSSGLTGSSTLPAAASSMLTSDQQAFAARLSADTGLNPGVISAWLLAEESGGAAQSRQASSNNDWLNIGYTDSATYGSSDQVWSDPITAADATAGWLKGQNTIPGYGTASAGIQGILQTVGQPPATQIAALQGSGWASGGYPDLPTLYSQVTA